MKKVKKINIKSLTFLLSIFFVANANGYSDTTSASEKNNYQPYIQLGGTGFFHIQESNAAAIADLFVPLWQKDFSNLVFTDIRINDRSGTPFEGTVHLGYRHLFSDEQQMFGVYGAWDRKKTLYDSYFNQITVGAEYWNQSWFVGGNVYKPIGDTSKLLNQQITSVPVPPFDNQQITVDKLHEKAMPGADAEVGYEFIEGLVGYVGGYYFGASGVDTICGPRARLTYDWSLDDGRILGIFDKVGLEAGVQRDTPRGITGYLSANVRVGWLFDKKSELRGLSRHMIDPVRRDIDVISQEESSPEQEAIDLSNYTVCSAKGDSDKCYRKITNRYPISPDKVESLHQYVDKRITGNAK